MRVLGLTKQRVAMVATVVLVAACGGSSVEGRYLPRGDGFFESLTLGAEGRVEVVFIGQLGLGSYVIDGNAVTLTAENGDKSLFLVGDDGCLTNSILGTYCRNGAAPATGGGAAAAAATGGGASGGPETYEAVTQEGRIKLELLSDSQARMTMRPNSPGANGMPAQMSIDVFYERDGDNVLVGLPGEEPMELMRDGRDFVASMNGETARFVRQ
jgi:hypothetical protein